MTRMCVTGFIGFLPQPNPAALSHKAVFTRSFQLIIPSKILYFKKHEHRLLMALVGSNSAYLSDNQYHDDLQQWTPMHGPSPENIRPLVSENESNEETKASWSLNRNDLKQHGTSLQQSSSEQHPEFESRRLTKEIRDLGYKRQWREAILVFQNAVQNEFRLNTIHYNALINACAKSGRWKECLKILEDMRFNNVTRDVISYTAVISACEKDGNWKMALKVVREMISEGIKPDVVCFSALISGFGKGQKWKEAIYILENMKLWQVEPNIITYNAAMSVCEKSAQYKEAASIFELMRSKKIKPDVISYNTLISACEKTKNWSLAIKYLHDMELNGLTPNVISYSGAISACSHCGEYKMAVHLFQRMKEKEIMPDTVVYSSLISAAAQGHNSKLAVKIFYDMKANGVHPNVVTYGAVMKSFRRHQWFRTIQFYEYMIKDGIAPNLVIYRTVLDACRMGRQSEKTLEIFKAMLKSHPPDASAWSIAAGALLSANNYPEAYKIMIEMDKLGFVYTPNGAAKKHDDDNLVDKDDPLNEIDTLLIND